MNPWDNGVIIRPWDEEDGPDMANLHRRAILATSDEFYTKEQRESWAHGLTGEGYAKSAANGENFIIAVDENDKPLAFCGYKNNEICGLYVDPDHQGKGIGKRLFFRACMNIFQSQPDKIFVDSSAPAVQFYEHFGYQVEREVTHDTRGGAKLNAFDMTSGEIEYSDLIGPHENRELTLMLEGKKRLAWFADLEPVDVFAPHVEAGTICRYEWHDYTRNFYDQFKDSIRDGAVIDVATIYYLPGEEALVEKFMDAIVSRHNSADYAWERKIGELLDYPPQAIDAFIAQLQTRATKGEATILDN